jgi:hypothetical protein
MSCLGEKITGDTSVLPGVMEAAAAQRLLRSTLSRSNGFFLWVVIRKLFKCCFSFGVS